MFDKMIFNVGLSVDNAQSVIKSAKLQKCLEGDKTFYKSTEDYKFSGIFITYKDDRLQIKCSLHKFYNKMVSGVLENCGEFSMVAAQFTFYRILEDLGVKPENANITYYEIGFNINTDFQPKEYIAAIKSVGFGNSRRDLFVDAGYETGRQKTSKKAKTVKKYFKIYDKGYEMADRRREDKTNTPNILRIETVYKHAKIKAFEFFNLQNLKIIALQFYDDWLSAEFVRTITADKGVKHSQCEKAEKIMTLGRENYLNEAKKLHKDLKISDKQFRGIKEFIRDWSENENKFRMLPTQYEMEFKSKLQKALNYEKY